LGNFKTTLWSLVGDAQASGEQANAAMAVLCETYWKPLYRYLLMRGFAEEDARDLLQGFFLKLIEKRYLDAADASKGRFRTFLLTCLNRYAANERTRERAQKRGGDLTRVHIDWDGGVGQTGEQLPAKLLTPDREFDRQWALALIARAFERLRENEKEAGRGKLVALLGDSLYLGGHSAEYENAAEVLGTTANAVKVAAHRMRKRLHRLIWEEVQLTVDSQEAAHEELKHLLDSLSQEQ